MLQVRSEIETSVAISIELKMLKSIRTRLSASSKLIRLSLHDGNLNLLTEVLSKATSVGGWVIITGMDNLESMESLS